MIKIIAGRWKRRNLTVLNRKTLRPTPAKVRETIFNWLSSRIDLSNSNVLDLFCGSGSLGIEAASRGARQVTLIDSDKQVIDQLNYFIRGLGNPENIKTHCKEALAWLTLNQNKKFDLIFLDPPFDSSLLKKTLPNLSCQVSSGGLVYVEYDNSIDFMLDSLGFEIICASKSGTIRYYLIMKKNFC